MHRQSGAPYLVLCLLAVLAVGAALLGVHEGPAGATLAVHNGAGETLAASSITAVYTSSTSKEVVGVRYVAPDRVTETLLEGGPPGRPDEVNKVKGPAAAQALTPISGLLSVPSFTGRGSTYVGSVQVSSLVPPIEAHLVSGTASFTATVTRGYAVDVVEHEVVTTPEGTETAGGRYRITRIGSWQVPGPGGRSTAVPIPGTGSHGTTGSRSTGSHRAR